MVEARRASVERNTKETQITLRLDLAPGPIEVDTGVKFFDHMLTSLATHAGLGLVVVAKGDGMDHQHLIEDVGIALGRALYEALGDKRGIGRFGSMMIPLDDALVAGSVDLSGRAYLNFAVKFTAEDLGDMKTEMVAEFFRALTDNGRFNLHLVQMSGHVNHHLCEAAFKAFARSFAQAKTVTGSDILSTKGVLE
jgi:imidazoleglycerol-phosphate dehydratase